jgi:hypothetical protein
VARGLLCPEGMKEETQTPFRLVTDVVRADPPSAPERTGWLVPSIVALGIAIPIVLLSVSPWSAERRAIRSLPDSQRLAILDRTIGEIRLSCAGDRPDALRNHCRELATFASRFDECRGECATLVRLQLAPVPTR